MFIPAANTVDGRNQFQKLLLGHLALFAAFTNHRLRLTDDGHEGVEVANVEALPGNVDEELDHLGPLLLFCRLKKEQQQIILSDYRNIICFYSKKNTHV